MLLFLCLGWLSDVSNIFGSGNSGVTLQPSFRQTNCLGQAGTLKNNMFELCGSREAKLILHCTIVSYRCNLFIYLCWNILHQIQLQQFNFPFQVNLLDQHMSLIVNTCKTDLELWTLIHIRTSCSIQYYCHSPTQPQLELGVTR